MTETLQPVFRNRLKSMYAGEPQQGSDGQVQINKQVRIEESAGMWLYDLCRALKPARTLEVGMAYGFSTLYFLAAIHDLGTGHHTAIDPWQNELWHDVGLTNVSRVGMVQRFDFIQETSIAALARLRANAERFDLIFIDGDHRFDGTLVDFTLAAELCPVGGSIVFDDVWFPAVRTVINWIRSNRGDFEFAISPDGWAHIRRVSVDSRKHNHFVDFSSRRSISNRIAQRVKRAISSPKNA